MAGHCADIVQGVTVKPVVIYFNFRHKNKFEDCYHLKASKNVEDDDNKNIDDQRKSEKAHQLVLKTTRPFGLDLM